MKRNGTLFDTGTSKTLKCGLSLLLTVAGFSVLSVSHAQAKFLSGHVESFDTDQTSSDTTRGITSTPVSAPTNLTTGGAQPGSNASSSSTVSTPESAPGAVPQKTSVPQAAAVPQTAVDPSSNSMSSNQLTAGTPVADNQLTSQTPVLAYSRPPAAPQTAQVPNSLPKGFAGQWQCVTRVIDSGVSSVNVGTELVSEVQFQEVQNGRVIARWQQPGWTETQSSALSWGACEAQVDRTSYYFGDGYNGAWASRSRDHFVQANPDQLECRSYVDQYIDGRYIGRYRTISILTRMGTTSNIALGSEKSR